MLVELTDLLGKIIVEIDGVESDSDKITFYTFNGEVYFLYHKQDCCENVYLVDVIGDITDLLDNPILTCECVTSYEEEELNKQHNVSIDDEYTWSFYKFSTIKGYVTFRWFGSSNGYYSTSVSFEKNQ